MSSWGVGGNEWCADGRTMNEAHAGWSEWAFRWLSRFEAGTLALVFILSDPSLWSKVCESPVALVLQ